MRAPVCAIETLGRQARAPAGQKICEKDCELKELSIESQHGGEQRHHLLIIGVGARVIVG